MVNNPYTVLGISENASDDEVKRAYRDLSRKYHPDSYVDNPLKDLAEDRFKEVQEAYDTIMKQRSGGYGGRSYAQGSGYQQSHSGYQSGYAEDRYQQVYNYINLRQYSSAMSELNSVPLPQRDGRWYYLSAITNAGMGNNLQAQNDINRAISIEPANPEYQN